MTNDLNATPPGNVGSQPPTVAEAIVAVQTWADLPKKRRDVLVSALRTACRIAEAAPSALRFTPEALNAKVLVRPSEVYGVKAPAMATVRTHLRFILRRLGLLERLPPISTEWEALCRRLGPRRAATFARIAAYCSSRQIPPSKVSDAVYAEFKIWVTEASLCRNPARMISQLRYCWNRASRELADLGLPILEAARCRQFSTIPLEAMHPALQADLARMRTRLGTTDLDDSLEAEAESTPKGEPDAFNGTPRKPLKVITVEERLRHARQAVWALVQAGVPLADIRGIRDLVQPIDHARRIVSFMWQRGGKRPSTSAGHVAEVLRQIAKYHVDAPKEDVDRIAGWKKKVAVEYKQMTEKNRSRLELLLAPDAEQKLLSLPGVLLKEAHGLLPMSPSLAVSAAKRGLFIHLELFYPFRISNIICLRRDRHFLPAEPGRDRVARFLIPADEVKNAEAIDRRVLDLTNAFLAAWEGTFRPLIAAPGNPFLFPGKGDQAMRRQSMGASLKKVIIERVGCEIHPHLLRHRAAVAHLKKHPGDFEVVRLLLGHKTDQTARRSYTGPERDAAFDRFDQSVLEDMQSLRPSRRGKRIRRAATRQADGATKRRRPAPEHRDAGSTPPRRQSRAKRPSDD